MICGVRLEVESIVAVPGRRWFWRRIRGRRVREGGERHGSLWRSPDQVGRGTAVVLLDDFDSKVVEEGLAVAGEPQRDREGAVGGGLAEEKNALEFGNWRRSCGTGIVRRRSSRERSRRRHPCAGNIRLTSTEMRIRLLRSTRIGGDRIAATGKSRNGCRVSEVLGLVGLDLELDHVCPNWLRQARGSAAFSSPSGLGRRLCPR